MSYNIICQHILYFFCLYFSCEASRSRRNPQPLPTPSSITIPQYYAQKIHHPATHCAPNISGIPRRNFQCLVLWRNICIPIIAPMLPPAAAKRKRVFSDKRQPLFLAWRLSCPNPQNVTIFMSIIYKTNICVMAIESLSL